LLRIPFFGKVAKELALTRILGNIKMLMVSGVPIVQAFTIGSKTAGNLVYEDELIRISRKLELGNSLHTILSQRPGLFPSLAVTMAKVGEETGKLDEIMGKLQSFYENRVDTVFSNLSTIIEPFLLLSIGVMVGFIAISVIMPIYNLAQAF
jgi:type IV pilus assembly protein PilC